jgi:glycosyltransferase 2 family protein
VPSNSSYSCPPASILGGNRKIAKQVAAILVAGMLAWLAFRGANLSAVMAYARGANVTYLGLLCLSVLFSHLLRAWRWLILLRPVANKPISLWHSFCAVIYGYAANIIVPRGGEIVRLLSICKSETLPWAGVLPTLLIDRLLDLVMLALLLGFTLVCLPPAQLAHLPWLYPCGISLIVSTVVLFLALPVLAPIVTFIISLPSLRRLIAPNVFSKIKNLLEQFELGTRSLPNPFTYPLIAFFSLAIWFFYWLNFHLVLAAFALDQKLTLNKELMAFTIASIGALVPTPGCIGGFHFLVSKSLALIGSIDQNLALAFATVLHAFAFVIIIASTAAACFLWQNCHRDVK